MMSIVLNNQVEASERSAQSLHEELMNDHHLSMLCQDVQDQLKQVIGTFSSAKEHVAAWRQSMEKPEPKSGHGGQPDSFTEIATYDRKWEELFRRIGAVFEKTAQVIKLMEGHGYAVSSKEEFMRSWKELRGIVCFSVDQFNAGVEQLKRGEVRPLGEFEVELLRLPNDASQPQAL